MLAAFTPVAAVAGFPGVSGRIAFVSDRDAASNTEIYSMNPDAAPLADPLSAADQIPSRPYGTTTLSLVSALAAGS